MRLRRTGAALVLALVGVGSAGAAGAAAAGSATALPSSAITGTSSVRYSGADRYATSAEVSRLSWSPGDASVVHLASGEVPADALSIGASTLGLGPVLLTRADALPAPVEAELQRLAPCMVVVVGGTTAISDAVAQRAAVYADPERCRP